MGAKRLAGYAAKTFQPSASSSVGYQERLTTRDVLQVAVTVEKVIVPACVAATAAVPAVSV